MVSVFIGHIFFLLIYNPKLSNPLKKYVINNFKQKSSLKISANHESFKVKRKVVGYFPVPNELFWNAVFELLYNFLYNL